MGWKAEIYADAVERLSGLSVLPFEVPAFDPEALLTVILRPDNLLTGKNPPVLEMARYLKRCSEFHLSVLTVTDQTIQNPLLDQFALSSVNRLLKRPVL